MIQRSTSYWLLGAIGLGIASLLFTGCRSLGIGLDRAAETEVLPPVPREFRAAWIATVANIDWPSEPGLPVAEQKAELRRMLDQAAALNLNAVIFQVRPHADALYRSDHEPWSAYLMGRQGQAPAPHYDPLALAIREAHARGLELHAWFNPFRAGHPADTSALAPDHIGYTNPELVVEVGDYLWLDPGWPAARAHSRRVIMDVVRRYDIDGVHFDDYFYPYPSYAGGADFPDDASWAEARRRGTTLSRADWRRQNVNQFVERLYAEIKAVKPHVKFGISPFGIWRPGHPPGTTGFDAYDELYADARTWLTNGWVDYMAPQLYYAMDQTGQPYPIMLRWWIEQNDHDRHIWPGNYTSRVRQVGDRHWGSSEIIGQIYATRSHPAAAGNIHFSMKALMPVADSLLNPADTLRADSLADSSHPARTAHPASAAYWQEAQRLVDRMQAEPYATPALVPASPWLNDDPPRRPVVTFRETADRLILRMTPSDEGAVRWWVVRWRVAGEWAIDIVPGAQRRYVIERSDAESWPNEVAVSAVDRLGNEGPAVVLDRWAVARGESVNPSER
jgi:uncharacterized lipoprotein YddW (UPF0748 family)